MSQPDDLLAQINRLKDRAKQTAFDTNKKIDHSTAGKVQRHVSSIQVFLYQVVQGLHWIYKKIWRPIWRNVFTRVGRWIFSKYRRLWYIVVYTPDKYGIEIFSKSRAGIMLILTFGYVYFLFLPLVVLGFDTSLYLLTVKLNEQIFLDDSQETYPEHNIHSVEGCHQLPCTQMNSIYFRVQPDLFNQLWSLIHHGDLFYPDLVAAAVPNVPSDCVITSYGVRVKLFMNSIEIYPHLLSVSCNPLIGKSS